MGSHLRGVASAHVHGDRLHVLVTILLQGFQKPLVLFWGPISTLRLLLLLHAVLLVSAQLAVHHINLVTSLPQFILKLLNFSLLVDNHVATITELIL